MISDRITLQLYDENDQPAKLLQRTGVRWGVLKKLIQFEDNINKCENDGERLELTMDMVSYVFEGQATAEEIEKGARFEDALRCFTQIMQLIKSQRVANFQKADAKRQAAT